MMTFERCVDMKMFALIMFVFSASLNFAQQTSVIKFEQLRNIINTPTESIKVINFWATWCAPCVKELPLFEKLNADTTLNVKVTLINLDFADKIERVNTFIRKKNIKSAVFLLDEVDYNTWIDKVDKQWSGAIPATLVINTKTGKRQFVERELAEGELEKLIAEVR